MDDQFIELKADIPMLKSYFDFSFSDGNNAPELLCRKVDKLLKDYKDSSLDIRKDEIKIIAFNLMVRHRLDKAIDAGNSDRKLALSEAKEFRAFFIDILKMKHKLKKITFNGRINIEKSALILLIERAILHNIEINEFLASMMKDLNEYKTKKGAPQRPSVQRQKKSKKQLIDFLQKETKLRKHHLSSFIASLFRLSGIRSDANKYHTIDSIRKL